MTSESSSKGCHLYHHSFQPSLLDVMELSGTKVINMTDDCDAFVLRGVYPFMGHVYVILLSKKRCVYPRENTGCGRLSFV